MSVFQNNQVIAIPATLKLPGDLGYATMTQANLYHYTDVAVTYTGAGTFKTNFFASRNGFDWDGEVITPWRVTLISSDLTGLVNADVIQDLCPPPSPELANADWIKPGKSVWHWMVTGNPKLVEQNKWVDWTAQLGFDYYLIDDGWVRWTAPGKDNWACMKDVVDYATTKNVKIWEWVNCSALVTPEARRAHLTKAKAAGMVGIKIDFMNSRPGVNKEDVFWTQWYDDILRDMAEFKLMVDFHGALMPTGRERVWPNELTREGIRGHESGKLPSVLDTALPFTRFVNGHADYTPTDFRPNKAGGSSAKELSEAIVYTSPFLCFCGDPANYLVNPALDVLKAIPPTWDETIVLPASEIGEIAAFARRKDKEWFIGVINGKTARKMDIGLKFLPAGSFTIDKLADSPDKPDDWVRTQATVSAADKFTVDLRNDGGFVAHITPAK